MDKVLPIAISLLLCSAPPLLAQTSPQENSETNLKATVRYLSEEIGVRSYRDLGKLNKAAGHIESQFRSFGCIVSRQAFTYAGRTYYNIIAEVKGTNPEKKEIIVVGAHYDTVSTTPGADDNASGIAGLLELSRLFAAAPAERSMRFVAFSLEEPPAYGTEYMGSYVYAKQISEENVPVLGMISLEMIGYFCDEKDCQKYPPVVGWFFPNKGDFISFVGNISSRSFTRSVKKAFLKSSSLPVESLNTVSSVTGVDFSDHRNFWKFGFDAFMITDTSFYRNSNYHEAEDTGEKLDFKRMNQLVTGLAHALREI